ncbi:CopG family ribbon-helix-helix protein [Sphingomonas floccifaciens]|uniref:CopG family ribbon-helix-helix protein n=1 Tax=Sphingomonas floccifaciens TaxID=1844115 RepID=A0ABW4NCL8_9SPHN
MNALSHITAALDAETFSIVERLAGEQGRSVEDFAAEAIRRVAESEADYRAFLQVGIDALDRGEFVTHEEVMAKLDAMIARHEARCRD